MLMSNRVIYKTIFSISHRMGSLMHCDRIMVIEQGTLVGFGCYQELIKECPSFNEIALAEVLEDKESEEPSSIDLK